MSEFKAPEGWALVPVKPTQDMVNAAKEIDGRLSVWKWADGYAAMLKEAPKPPEDHVPDAGKKVGQDCEPFGYFRAEPFGWTDCAPDDEGARPLYEAPPKRERTYLEQFDLDQSLEYRKGYEDGRLKGYEVGYRHATDHEREACAVVCESLPAPEGYSDFDKSMFDIGAMDCASAIRARGQS